MRPTPRKASGKWVLDLRWAGFGQRYPLGPDHWPEGEAIHASWALLQRLRSERAAEPRSQLGLRAPTDAPEFFADVVDEWERRKEYSTLGGERYGRTYARHVRKELGAYQLFDFLPPDGADRLRAYREGLVKAGLAPNTVANRLSVVRQVLAFAAERGWLPVIPPMPMRPHRRAPSFRWIEESHFRAIRSDIYAGAKLGEMSRAPGVVDDRTMLIYIERRRCYLSWLFYTGCHTADADTLTADFVSLDVAVYRRRNSKSASVVPDESFDMPEPLADDLRRLVKLLGRPFLPEEPVTGGPWPNVSRLLQLSAKRLGFGIVNPRVLRRSCARELYKLGFTEMEVAQRLGHVDTRMIHEVYLRVPRASGTGSRWKRSAASSAAPPPPPGRVLSFVGTATAKNPSS